MWSHVSKRWACVAIAVPMLLAALPNSRAQPPDLVTAVGTEFAKDGRAYRFIGVNIRGLVHYGGGDALPYSNLEHIDENLAGAAAMGCRVVRVFAANRHISHQEAVDRLGYALDKAEEYGLKLIIALTDFYPTSFHPQGDDGYYTLNPWGWTVLNHEWFAGGYQQNYLPYVTLAVAAHKDHAAVFSWQLGNEIADQVDADTHDAFVHAVAGQIKSIDPDHMVSIGMLSLAHIPGYTAERGIELYGDDNLDFITAHRYNDQTAPIDFQVRDAVVKPTLISEAGCDRNHPAVPGGDRVAFMDGRVDYFVHERAARGFMNWGYQAQAYDIGDGDNIYGVDRYAHPDYDAMFAMYAGHAAILNAYDEPVDPNGLRGRNLALETVAWQTDSDYGPDWTGDRAFDADLSTKWTSTNATATHWLVVDLGAAYVVTGFRVQMASAGGEWPLFNFEHYALQSGPSLTGPWSTCFEVSNPGQVGSITSAFETPIRTRCVRLYVDDCGIDDYARLPELEVIGDPPPRADRDQDGDVDLRDVAVLQRAADDATANLDAVAKCLCGPDVEVPLECY
jgi:hypothetical protein